MNDKHDEDDGLAGSSQPAAHEHFRALLDLHTTAREAGLGRLREEDAQVAAQVERLLDQDARTRGPLERAREAVESAAAAFSASSEFGAARTRPERLGAWRILERLGEGGMGEVWSAEREVGGFAQRAAIKLVRPAVASAQVFERFRRERQVLAALSHPAIAKVLDGGVAPDGRPWFAMELVEGVALDDWARARDLSVAERLRLMIEVCDAVDFAHRNLVVHRDLKPSNILVGEDGQPKLLDFGLAKLLAHEEIAPSGDADPHEDVDPDPALTRSEVRVLTPAYAAPEQILGEPVTTASDVYSLGVVLYELLVERLPHHRSPTMSWPELVAAAQGEPDAKPSTAALLQAAQGEPPGSRPAGAEGEDVRSRESLRRRARAVRGDLDLVVLKALRREPERRYSSAAAFAEDLRRVLRHEPVQARPDSAAYRAARFVRRHRVGVAAAVAVLAALVVGLVATLWQARRAELQSRRAEEAQVFLAGLFANADPERTRGENLTAREVLERGAELLDTQPDQEPAVRAELRRVIGQVFLQLDVRDKAIVMLERSIVELRAIDAPPRQLGEALKSHGLALHRAARYDEAKARLEEARAMFARAREWRLLANTLNDLGNVERATGRPEAALPFFTEGLALEERRAGAKTPEYAKLRNNRGLALWRLERRADAIADFEAALAIHERNEGAKSPLVGSTLLNLTLLYVESGDLDKARVAGERCEAILLAAYGENHRLSANAINALGNVHSRSGNLEAAAASYKRAAEVYERVVGAMHPDRAWPVRNLGNIRVRQGRAPEAFEFYREALAIREAAYSGKPHSETVQSLLDVGMGYLGSATPEAGLLYLGRAVEMARSLAPDGSTRLANALFTQGRVLLASGRRAEAVGAFEECLALRTRLLAAEDSQIEEAKKALARAREGQGPESL